MHFTNGIFNVHLAVISFVYIFFVSDSAPVVLRNRNNCCSDYIFVKYICVLNTFKQPSQIMSSSEIRPIGHSFLHDLYIFIRNIHAAICSSLYRDQFSVNFLALFYHISASIMTQSLFSCRVSRCRNRCRKYRSTNGCRTYRECLVCPRQSVGFTWSR